MSSLMNAILFQILGQTSINLTKNLINEDKLLFKFYSHSTNSLSSKTNGESPMSLCNTSDYHPYLFGFNSDDISNVLHFNQLHDPIKLN